MKSLNLVIGKFDDPEKQVQDDYSIDLYRHNIAIFGSSMSGKTTMLKTLLFRMHQVLKNAGNESIYILDFYNGLEHYRNLPYVTALFDAQSEENVRRIFHLMEENLNRNLKLLKGQSFIEYVQDDKLKIEKPMHYTFLIDGLDSLMMEPRYIGFMETLTRISRDGLSKGISVVFTAYSTSGGIGKLLANFNRRIAFDVQAEQYGELFSGKVTKPIINKGRGIINDDTNWYEFQAYFPYNTKINEEEGAALDSLQVKLKECGVDMAQAESKKIYSFSSGMDLTVEDSSWKKYVGKSWAESCQEAGNGTMIAGVDYYSFKPVEIPLKKAQSIAIYGKKEFGKSNLLALLLETSKRMNEPVQYVFFEDKREGLHSSVIQGVVDSLPKSNVTWCYDKEQFVKYLYVNCFLEKEKNAENLDENRQLPKRKNGIKPPRIWDDDALIARKEEPVVAQHQYNTVKENRPFTIFVIQWRFFYQLEQGYDDNSLIYLIVSLVESAEQENALFVFSDVKRIASSQERLMFNNVICHAFLLDDIVNFINDKGRTSVFGEQDVKELKEQFGRCERGDGFYFDLERYDLKKVKFIKFEFLERDGD